MLKSEKQLKDKAVRERDELSADKFTMEQELKVGMMAFFA